MNGDWVLLGYRIVRRDKARLADRWGTSSFLSVSEWMVDIFPSDIEWYSVKSEAIESWAQVSAEFDLVGVGFHRSCLDLLTYDWAPPSAVAGRLQSDHLELVPADALILGYEPVALWYQTIFSWRYFGGTEIAKFMAEHRSGLTDTGLIRSFAEADEVAERMSDLTLAEGYPWVTFLVFGEGGNPLATLGPR